MTTATGVTRIAWQRLDVPGAEWCEVERASDGTRIAGVVIVPDDGRPYRVDYVLRLDPEGRTRQVEVDAVGATGDAASVRLTADGKGTWRSSSGLVLESSPRPSTRTSASRRSRTHCRSGASACEPARGGTSRSPGCCSRAWRSFHGRQSYERLDELTYVYRSSGFEAQIEVFPDGLVREYRGLWRAVARSAGL